MTKAAGPFTYRGGFPALIARLAVFRNKNSKNGSINN